MTSRRTLHMLIPGAVVAVLTTACAPIPVASPPPTSPEVTTEAPTPPAVLEQPALWPAAETAFTTPEDAASDFLSQALSVPPVLSEYMAGDSRSGEFEVYAQTEDGHGRDNVRSVISVRQLGPENSWYVIAANNDSNTITAPAPGAAVPAGPVVVTGMGRGFEGVVVVQAFTPGDPTPLDTQTTTGGSMEDPEPFSVTLDLSSAVSGQTVAIIVKGSTGLETDPGDFAAQPITIA